MVKDELICKYLNGELDPDEERKVLHMIADDEDLRSMLHIEQKLNRVFTGESAYRQNAVPEGFAEDVMRVISEKEESTKSEKEKTINRESVLMDWFRKLWVSRQVQWRPVYALATVLLLIASFSYMLLQDDGQLLQSADLENSVQPVSSSATEVVIRFTYFSAEAKSVAVAGDFSNWEPIKLSKRVVNGKQIWTGLVTMSRGVHSYMFVKNGSEWVTDPLALIHRSDGFGNKNAVIYL